MTESKDTDNSAIMSLVQPTAIPDPEPSPSLTISIDPAPSLASNNPFRNRAASPTSVSPAPSPRTTNLNSRPASRNPFLDVFDNDDSQVQPGPKSPHKSMSFSNASTEAHLEGSGNAADLFKNLVLDGRPRSSGSRHPPEPMDKARLSAQSQRSDNLQPNQWSKQPGGHRPTRSENEGKRNDAFPVPPRSAKLSELDIFADPSETSKSRDNRPRRNSESSILESRTGKVETDEERRRRRERRQRESKNPDGTRREGRPHGSSSRPRKPNHRLDLIDKLDVTSIYGTGLFHHDGPFDACNPHRNRNARRAPMQAFPKGSANNSLGGAPLDPKNVDHSQYYGNRDAEAFTDFSASGVDRGYGYDGKYRPSTARAESFNATARVDPVHGDETLGLGTSTFLEGAPASRTAMQRRESETEANIKAGGLQRKKSLAQKIKGISSNRQNIGPSGRVTSPEPVYGMGTALTTPGNAREGPEVRLSPTTPGGSKKANENNPFFANYDAAWEKKSESIAISEQEKIGRARAPSSPRRGLERRLTAENGVPMEGSGKGMGLLQRVKSLKGAGRRARPSEKNPAQAPTQT